MVQAREPSHRSGYLRLVGLPPTGSHACYTPWSVFQDGQFGGLPPASRGRSSQRGRGALQILSQSGDIGGVTTTPFVPPDQPTLTSTQRLQPAGWPAWAWVHPQPPNPSPSTISSTFHSLFKVLFIFPSRYLFAIGLPPVFSLRWDLPPALGCIPKQPDSANAARGAAGATPTGFSPSGTPSSKGLGRGPQQSTHLYTTIRRPRVGDFQIGLFPVRSPLLGESWLVSFPPLIDMLKFSGCSCLISGRRFEVGQPRCQAGRRSREGRGAVPLSSPGDAPHCGAWGCALRWASNKPASRSTVGHAVSGRLPNRRLAGRSHPRPVKGWETHGPLRVRVPASAFRPTRLRLWGAPGRSDPPCPLLFGGRLGARGVNRR